MEKSKQTNRKFDSLKELLYDISEKRLGITKEQILSKKRTRTLADTRRVIMRILKTAVPKSTVYEVGAAVARDHSSVSTQLKEHKKLYESNKDYTELFNMINDEFQEILNSNKPLAELYKDKETLETRLSIVNKAIEEIEANTESFKFIA